MVDHEVDFGPATLPLLHPQVTTEVLFTREDVVICPPGSPLARESVVSLAQVSPYPLWCCRAGVCHASSWRRPSSRRCRCKLP